jgi:hypothetical protein
MELLNPTQKDIIYVPNLAKDIIEQISFDMYLDDV